MEPTKHDEYQNQPSEETSQNNAPVADPVQEAGSSTALIALAIIVLVILAGAFFIFGDKYNGDPETEGELEAQFEVSQGATQEEIAEIRQTSDSTALSDIERDLNQSDLSDLDAELDAVDQEFNG